MLTRWDNSADQALHQLVCYIWTTIDDGLVGYVNQCIDMSVHEDKTRERSRQSLQEQINESSYTIPPHVSSWGDADLASCPFTQRSTTGVHVAMMGPFTHYPLQYSSKRQSATALSTPEAEIVAANFACLYELGPTFTIITTTFGSQTVARHYSDNAATLSIIAKNRNMPMRYLDRTPSLSLAKMHELFKAPEYTL